MADGNVPPPPISQPTLHSASWDSGVAIRGTTVISSRCPHNGTHVTMETAKSRVWSMILLCMLRSVYHMRVNSIRYQTCTANITVRNWSNRGGYFYGPSLQCRTRTSWIWEFTDNSWDGIHSHETNTLHYNMEVCTIDTSLLAIVCEYCYLQTHGRTSYITEKNKYTHLPRTRVPRCQRGLSQWIVPLVSQCGHWWTGGSAGSGAAVPGTPPCWAWTSGSCGRGQTHVQWGR